MSIIQRLGIMIAILSAAMVGIGSFSYAELNAVQQTALKTKDSRIVQLREAGAVELNVTRVSLQLRHAMLARSPAEAEAAYRDIREKRELISKILKDYESRIISTEGRNIFNKIPPLVDAFWAVGEQNLALIQKGHKDEAFAYLVEKTIPARNALLQALEDTVTYQTGALSTDIQDIRDRINLTLLLQLGAFAVFIGLLGGFAWWLKKIIEQRIEQSMAIAAAVAGGDLTVQVSEKFTDEFSPMLDAMSQMQASLTKVVGDVRQAAMSVTSASTEISAGNRDLASRTEQQASSVQQTVTTMDELNATAVRNAASAEQAKALASAARGTARNGGDAMNAAVSTMDDIAQGSKRISDITQVIDSIAFQTNILALNAAVEAARAGEQGRGFAVVASEVRALAQRSAQAAKEISSLIQESSAHVKRGSDIVTHAGKTMNEVVESIQKVDQIMEELRDAGTSQARGFQGINAAVESIDRSTQQNAALVEQSSASSELLYQRATELMEAVAVFRLQRI